MGRYKNHSSYTSTYTSRQQNANSVSNNHIKDKNSSVNVINKPNTQRKLKN